MSGTHEHLEHAEHDGHHALDPANRKVAFTMAIVAAVLAGVTMLGHRAHNDTLRLATVAGTLKVEASNAWAQYQAKRMRQHLDQNVKALLRLLPESEGSKGIREAKLEELNREIQDYSQDLKDITAKAKGFEEQAKDAEHHAHTVHERANWLDFAHLAVELALVLCSITLLTRKPEYWYAGLLAAGVGLGLVAVAYTMH